MSEEGDISNLETSSDSDGEKEAPNGEDKTQKAPMRIEPFDVVLKGGSPWGFTVCGGSEERPTVQISELIPEGKAAQSGQLKVGDHILSVNDVTCGCHTEAVQLIQSAFRTLTLRIWRVGGEPVTSPNRTESFLHKARELQERASRHSAKHYKVQDDSVVFTQSKSTSFRMKPRQRRIESFHEGRGHPQPGNSISQGRYTPLPPQPTVDPQSYPSSVSGQVDTVPDSSAPLTTLRGNLRGWATQQDLSALRSPITVNTTNVPTRTYPGPLSPAKSTPVLNKENISPTSPRAYSSMQPQTLIPAKSNPDIPENLATSLHSPPSPSLYNIPRSPYTKQYFEFNVQQQRKHPFQGSSFSPFVSISGNPYNEPQNMASVFSNGRRSVPPQMPASTYRQEYLPSSSVPPQLRDQQKATGSIPTTMPMTKEEDELDKEIPNMQPAGKEDNRPLYSPPAPPVRDISSLKYIGFNQNHEKYPSWPVPHPNPDREGNPPLDPQTGYHPQLGPVHEKERMTFEENKPRNASDPGFNKEMKKNFYTRRKPTAKDSNNDYENMKTLEERFEDFCNNSKPGYPPPLFDPDGHNIGDEKYNIPSPPERDVSQLDQKTLAHKIAAVVSSGYQSQGQGQPDYYSHYSADSSYAANRKRVDTTTSPIQSQGVSSQSGQLPQNSKMVDSSTSPLNSPLSENKAVLGDVKYSRGTFQPSGNKSRGVIIRQTPYYNTGTQTEDLFSKGKDNMGFSSSDPPRFTEKSVQAQMSYSSVSSDCEGTSRYSDEESRSKHLHQEFPLDSYMEHSKSADHRNSTTDSGIMSINSDIVGAPLLRKLSEEFRGGKLHSIPSNFDDLRSPRPESLYGSLHGAESYSSVVIHPYENPMPFGRDDYGSNAGSKSDSLSGENTPVKSMSSMDLRNPPATKSARYSVDGSFARQSLGMSFMPHRSLPDSQYTSESSLNSPYYSRSKEHSQSMIHLNKRSLGSSQAHSFHFPSESSLQPRTSSEAGPSRSLKSSSDSSSGRSVSRLGSDSVFPEKSPGPAEPKDPTAIDSFKLITSPGSRGPLKYPYSSLDENERPSSTLNFHQRTESDVSVTSNDFPTASHSRSVSYTDYMPMYGYTSQSQADANRLAQIQEESSESRWQAAVDKSRSMLDRNYMNMDHGSSREPIQSEKVTDSPEAVPSSEGNQKPEFKRQQSDHFKFSNTGSDSSNKASESSSNIEMREPRTDSTEDSNRTSDDLKRMQQKAVLNFMEIKLKGKGQNLGEDVKPDSKSESSQSEQESSSVQPIIDFSKYNYTRDQRNESLRRSRSISSNSSRDSADYVEMKRPERLYAQTEWSRIRLQTGRPSSIGSDASGSMDTYMISPLSPLPPSPLKGEPGKSGDPVRDQISGPGLFTTNTSQQLMSPSSSSSMVASPVSPTYSNLQDNPRRIPPPPPRQVDEGEEQPPALPPRSYRNMPNSTSDSVLLRPRENLSRSEDKKDDKLESRPLHHKWDNSPREDTYAEQLRKQARRLSEHRLHPMATSMSIMTTKTPMHTTQSYKQEQAQALEATSIKSIPGQESAPGMGLYSSAMPSAGDSEPPPLPPPREVNKGESVESSRDTEFPLPPPEVLQDSSNENGGVDHRLPEDGCADDSYGSYKSRTYNRHLGTYKRTQSDSNVQQNITDKANHKDMAEVPNKPPRKKLEQSHENLVSQHSNFRDSPLSHVESSSINHDGSELAIPTFQASEIMPGKTVQMFVAQPLQVSNKTLDNSNPGSFLKMSPKMSTSDSVNISGSKSEQAERKTVQDRIRNLEHSHYSPNSAPNRTSIPKTSAVNNVKNMFESLSGSPDERERSMLVKKSSFSRTQNSYQESKGSSEKFLENSRTGGEQILTPEDLQLNKRSLNDQTPPVNRSTPQHSEGLLNQGTRHDQTSASSVQGISNSFPSGQSSGDLSIHRTNVENRTEQTMQSKSQFSSSRLVHSQLDVRADPGPQTRERTGSGSCPPGSNHSLEKQVENSVADSPFRSRLDFKNENRLSSPRPALLDLNQQKGISGVPSQDSQDSDVISPPSELPFIRYGKRPHHSSGNKAERQLASSSVTKASSLQGERPLTSSNSSQQPTSPLEWQQQTIPKFSEQISNQNQRTSLKSDKCLTEENKINKSSQESLSKSSASGDVSQIVSVHRREPSHEELECDKKAEELVEVLKDSEKKLTEVLRPDNKNRMDYMDGLFTTPVDIKTPNKSHSFSHKISAEKDAGKVDSEKMDTKNEEDNSPKSPLPSTYYVSSSKARIEIDMRHHKEASLELIEDIGDNDSLVRKKEELLQSMMKKLDILNEEKRDIMQEISENEGLGKKVTQIVEQKCTNQNEKDKYKSYIDDIEKIVRLLLKLSGLLARAENAVQSLPKDANDKVKKMTLEKREKLYSQHEDAKDLKRDVDRRSQQVAGFLEKCLDSSEMDDYNYFVSMKSKLTIQMQELEDKIALGNEQIQALQKSIPHRK